jgi:hypothetical protein
MVAGAPAINWTKLLMQSMWGTVQMNAAGNPVAACKLAAATAAAIAACDAQDGVKDGVIDNPTACKFDPMTLIGTSAPNCGDFTEADANLIRKLWEGPRRQDGSFLWYGQSRGADLRAVSGTRGTPLQTVPFGFSVDWLRYFLAQNPQFDANTVTPDAYERLWEVPGGVRDCDWH